MTEQEDDINYPDLVADLLTIIDRIEEIAEDQDEVVQLCRARFRIVRSHGMTIVYIGPAGTA